MKNRSYRESHISKNHGKKYDVLYVKDSYDSRVWLLEKEILELIFRKHFNSKVINHLDFACGTGRLLEVFENKAITSFGIDVSNEMLRIARKKYRNTKFIECDITKNQNIFNQRFNLITAFRFFLNAEMTLRKHVLEIFYRILEDDGILIFNIHGNKNSLRFLPLRIRNFLTKNKLNSISFREIKKLIEENNLKIIEVYGLSFLPQIFSKILPKAIWFNLEKVLHKIKLFNMFGIDLIFICSKNL